MAQRNTLLLFDVDGTLTKPRGRVTPDMKEFLARARTKAKVGIVGGSDLHKIKEQLGDNIVNEYDYVFSENGLVGFRDGQMLPIQSLKTHYSEQQLKDLINFCLRYIADLDIPIKRGTFVEFRAGMINVSPIGRNCSQEERDEFEAYDHAHGIRQAMKRAIEERFADMNMKISIGGQISMDCFPNGWDKTFCLRHLAHENFDEIHFFGDKTDLGGNDHEIYVDERTIGHKVVGPEDTMRQVSEVLGEN
eukprot:TRINITY_DN4736_c0_g1_i3.p1 TRINITY_DN4736_c0_g1~~TRINITY_DN4736_c0_g1_i3.p1  ORF type:complete len:248 (-),score=78.67 TRINITY_DN4736_c0_g1_i3:224-967(-)